jgi:hypothetical protein
MSQRVAPSKELQQTGHATNGPSCFSATSRVSRLLGGVVRRRGTTQKDYPVRVEGDSP